MLSRLSFINDTRLTRSIVLTYTVTCCLGSWWRARRSCSAAGVPFGPRSVLILSLFSLVSYSGCVHTTHSPMYSGFMSLNGRRQHALEDHTHTATVELQAFLIVSPRK